MDRRLMNAIRCRCKAPQPGEADPLKCSGCGRPILKKRSRSGIERVHHAGRSFMSGLEARVFDGLKRLEQAGVVRDIQCQVHIKLSRAEIGCIPDFRVFDVELNEYVFHEAKGFESERWPIILKLWRVYGPGRMVIWRASRSKGGEPFISETVIPNPGPSKLRLAADPD